MQKTPRNILHPTNFVQTVTPELRGKIPGEEFGDLGWGRTREKGICRNIPQISATQLSTFRCQRCKKLGLKTATSKVAKFFGEMSNEHDPNSVSLTFTAALVFHNYYTGGFFWFFYLPGDRPAFVECRGFWDPLLQRSFFLLFPWHSASHLLLSSFPPGILRATQKRDIGI